MATAETVPAALAPHYYRDPEVLEAEQRRIFARTWQFVGHVSQLPSEGNYTTASAGVREEVDAP